MIGQNFMISCLFSRHRRHFIISYFQFNFRFENIEEFIEKYSFKTMGNNEVKFKEIFEEMDKNGDKKLCYVELDQFFYQAKALNILREMSESEQSKYRSF